MLSRLIKGNAVCASILMNARSVVSEAGSGCANKDAYMARINGKASAQIACLGSAHVSHACERVLAIADFLLESLVFSCSENRRKDCFGATPSTARQARALPRVCDATLIVAPQSGPASRGAAVDTLRRSS